jgi:glycosyltransferase involved in cell wall biosynthesis
MPTDVPANVTVWQGLSWCDLRDLYARAAVVAVPLIGRTDYAAGANAALETMAMCRPLVVTATPGIADDVVGEEMALFPPPDDPAALAHYLERSLAHPRLTAQRVDSARATVEARNAVERYVAALAGTIAEVNGS